MHKCLCLCAVNWYTNTVLSSSLAVSIFQGWRQYSGKQLKSKQFFPIISLNIPLSKRENDVWKGLISYSKMTNFLLLMLTRKVSIFILPSTDIDMMQALIKDVWIMFLFLLYGLVKSMFFIPSFSNCICSLVDSMYTLKPNGSEFKISLQSILFSKG